MITVVLLLVILISVWIGFYQLVKQQGRMLLRLDELERNAKAAGAGAEEALSRMGFPSGLLSRRSDFPTLREKRSRSRTFAASGFC